MSDWLAFNSGRLVYRNRKASPPPAPDGYEATDDPYVFVISFVPCSYRHTKEPTEGCCTSPKYYCKAKGKPVKTNRGNCQKCNANPEWAKKYL
jgi:hypothetical protein